ncbi:MAG TPA: DUF6370 family protein [Flavisolibacter sp.]|jgi:hypothetical protein|nr:DUF6370 family protein [Flavisolibacter sp.]
MKKALLFSLSLLFSTLLFAQKKESKTEPDPAKKLYEVEASCGQCKLGLKGAGCTLAVRMDGKAYFVEGTSIDEHGDAHADEGFCNAIRKAKVQGEVVDGKFKATYFQLLPEATRKKAE